MKSDNKKECDILIGRHIPFIHPDYLLGSLKEAIYEYNCNSFMIYLASPRSSFRKKLEDFKLEDFKKLVEEKKFNIKNIIVHGSYLINFGNFKDEKKNFWGIELLKSDLKLMREIGLETIVIHPGNSLDLNRKDSLINVSRSIDKVLESVQDVRIALETMSGSGTQIGKNFDEIKFIIDNSKFKERIGVCWDTCHLYSSGYDIKNNLDSVLEEFKKKIGIEKLWVLHLNDSAFDFNSKRDVHENIGFGYLGIDCILLLSHHKMLGKVVKILETPIKNDLHKKEINIIKNHVFF